MQTWKLIFALLALSGLTIVADARAQQSHQVITVAFNYLPGQDGELGVVPQPMLSLTISQHDSLTVMNLDPPPHNITAVDIDPITKQPLFRSANVAFLGSGGVTGVESLNPGTYRFTCTVHPFMHGVLTVQ